MSVYELRKKMVRRINALICPVKHFKKCGEKRDESMRMVFSIKTSTAAFAKIFLYECEVCGCRACLGGDVFMPIQQEALINDWIAYKISTAAFLSKGMCADLTIEANKGDGL